jgi:hypothetical protein
MFMRVRRTVPHFTFVFSEGFVNLISSVSTGFFGVFAVLCGFGRFSGRFSSKKRAFAGASADRRIDKAAKTAAFWVSG